MRTDGTLTKKQAAQRRETAKAPKSTEEEREKCALCLEKVLCVEQRASRLGRVRCQALHAAFCWPCIEHLARTPTMWPNGTFVCPICRGDVFLVERIGMLGNALQQLRPEVRNKQERRARRLADGQRAADARADVSASVEATRGTADAAATAAYNELLTRIQDAVGSRGAAHWLTRELIGLAEGRPVRAAMPLPSASLPHRLVQTLLPQVQSNVELPRFVAALERVRLVVPPPCSAVDVQGRSQRSVASASVVEYPPEVDALVRVLIEYGALR